MVHALNTEYTLIIKNKTLNSNLGFNDILENKTLTQLPLETLSVGENDEMNEKEMMLMVMISTIIAWIHAMCKVYRYLDHLQSFLNI